MAPKCENCITCPYKTKILPRGFSGDVELNDRTIHIPQETFGQAVICNAIAGVTEVKPARSS